MSSRSSTSSFRRSLALAGFLALAVFLGLERAALPETAYYGGKKLAEKMLGLRALDRTEGVEVLAIGSSLVDLGFDAGRFTEVTGKTAYNAGVSGTDVVWQSRFLREVLIPTFEPEAVFWGIRDSLRTKSFINEQYLAAPALRHAAGPLGLALVDLERRLPEHRKRRLSQWTEDLLGSEEPRETLDAHGLTHTRSLTRPGPRADGSPRGHRMREEYGVTLDEARAEFEETLRFAAERGVRVHLFFTPYLEATYRRGSSYTREVLTGAYASFHDWMSATLAEHDIPLINLRYCAPVSGDESLFYDSKHVNRLGAAPVTELLARIYESGTVPPEWNALPSPAERAAMLGTFDAAAAPLVPLGQAVRTSDLLRVDDDGVSPVGMLGRVEVARETTLRLVISDRVARPTPAPLFVRIGPGRYHEWALPASPGGRAQGVPCPVSFRLPAGVHALELHARQPVALPFDELVVLDVGG
jgi:hypothetical protein